jgi:hypothetical protein
VVKIVDAELDGRYPDRALNEEWEHRLYASGI